MSFNSCGSKKVYIPVTVPQGGTGRSSFPTNKFIQGNGTGMLLSNKVVPDGDVVGTTDPQTLTNKTIDGLLNTITNVGFNPTLVDSQASDLIIYNNGAGEYQNQVGELTLRYQYTSTSPPGSGQFSINGLIVEFNYFDFNGSDRSQILIGLPLCFSNGLALLGQDGSVGSILITSGPTDNTTYVSFTGGYFATVPAPVENNLYSMTIFPINPVQLDFSGNTAITTVFTGPPHGPLSGNNNSSFGGALPVNTGDNNAGFGTAALYNNTTGGSNVAFGAGSLFSNTTGNYNVAIGVNAGNDVQTGERNIIIGRNTASGNANAANRVIIGNETAGTADDQIRIGFGTSPCTTCFIDGVVGVTTGTNDAIPVLVDSTGQLGTVSSSKKYKENISDIPDDLIESLYNLHPVSFNYKRDTDKKQTYGLIAEEVAELCPKIVVNKLNGENNLYEPETIQYHLLIPLLLSMIKNLKKEVDLLKNNNTNEN